MRLKYFSRRSQPYFCTIDAIDWNATSQAASVENTGANARPACLACI
jgi:hypothetical protein